MVYACEVEQAYRDMRNAPNYTSYKDRKRHYEKLLSKARRGIGWKQSCPTIMTDGNTIGVVVRKESKDDG